MLSSDSFGCKTSHDSSADTRQQEKVNPTTITTPFRSQSRNPDHTLQELSKAVAAAYIERTIRGTNPRPTFDVWVHNLLSEATQGKASVVADKRLPNH